MGSSYWGHYIWDLHVLVATIFDITFGRVVTFGRSLFWEVYGIKLFLHNLSLTDIAGYVAWWAELNT